MTDELVRRLETEAGRLRADDVRAAHAMDDARDRIEALTEAIGWALRVPSTGDGAAAESMRVILRRALEPQK